MNRIGELMCATALLASTGAFAQTATLTNDAAPVPVAGISLGAAASAAEQHLGGKAVMAEYEKQKDGQWVYDVEVRAGTRVFDVKVDPDKGIVIASTEDKADPDDDGDVID